MPPRQQIVRESSRMTASRDVMRAATLVIASAALLFTLSGMHARVAPGGGEDSTVMLVIDRIEEGVSSGELWINGQLVAEDVAFPDRGYREGGRYVFHPALATSSTP